MGIQDFNNFEKKSVSCFFQIIVHVNSLHSQTEGEKVVVFMKEDWERRVHGETPKSNWFL